MDVTKKLFELRDEKYAKFQAKLTPNIDAETMIGVRVPILRKFAKENAGAAEFGEFLGQLPHKYYDENMLHGILISEMRDYAKCMGELERFLPFVDNWAVCDIMSPKVFRKRREDLILKIPEWIKSKEVYTCRFGIEMLMTHFLDDDFRAEYLDWVAGVRSSEYYVQMMVAWFFATALAKQWDATIPFLTEKRLDNFSHNKTISKACESYRVTKEQKEILKKMRV